MKNLKVMKAPLLSSCRPFPVRHGLFGESGRLCVLVALREVFAGRVEGFLGEKAGSSLLDAVSGGSDLVLDGAFKVLDGAFKVLGGASKVLDGAFKVLDRAFKVLDRAFKVLGGAFKVLDGAFKVLDGAFKVLGEPGGAIGGAGKRPSTDAECLRPAKIITAFCEEIPLCRC